MRLSTDAQRTIRDAVAKRLGNDVRVTLFGSRLDDTARGGDIDVLVEMDTPAARPAKLAAELSTLLSRLLDGRRVDIVIRAPNLLELPIHRHAMATGVRL